MKNLILLFSCTLLSCATAAVAGADRSLASSAEISPRLFLQPAYIFDQECQQRSGFKIDPEIQTEFMKKVGNFQSEWDQRAKVLVSQSEVAAGRKFSRKEYSVALTLCKWTPMGDPAFIVSVRPYLGATRIDGKTKLPLGMPAFVSMLHHELLHSLVDNIVNEEFASSSALLEKYKDEHFNVLVHLHLMAIQKAVNEQVGDQDLSQATDQLYAYIGGDYQRAWDIVREVGAQKFLDELKAYNSKHE